MYKINKRNQTDFFKPLNKTEQDRLKELFIRIQWLEKKVEEREKTHSASSNLYRKELSATLWAIDYINAHNKKIIESESLKGKGINAKTNI